MKGLVCAAVVLAAVALAAVAQEGEKPKSDTELIRGTWEVVSADGAPRAVGLYFVFTADTMTFGPAQGKGEGLTVRYQLAPAKRPKAIDTTHELDPGKPIAQLGIYALEGDTLRLCLEAAGKARPTEFKVPAQGTGHLFVLKRVKAAGK